MNLRKCLYIGGTVCGTVLAFVLATGVWQPLAKADGNSKGPSFAVDPFWPKPLPAPVGTDGVAHTWVTGEIAGSCMDKLRQRLHLQPRVGGRRYNRWRPSGE